MKFKQKFTAVSAALLVAALVPINAMAAVNIRVSEPDRLYSVAKPFDSYIELESTGYGLIKNTATITLILKNGNFAKTEDGNFLPVYVTNSKKQLNRDEIKNGLTNNTINGFGVTPDDKDTIKLTIPQDMIDGYAQIMFSATADDYGNVSISIKDNRNIKYNIKSGEDREKEESKKEDPKKEAVEEEKTKVVIEIGSPEIYIGNEKLEIDVPAYISNDVTKLPLRAIAEIFGADVFWNGAEKSVTIEVGDDTAYLKFGDDKMIVNDFAVPLVSGMDISNGRTFIPLRDIAQLFGIEEMSWDENTKTVSFDLKEYSGHNYLTYPQHK